MELLPGAEPFRLEGGASRLLLLHGFASTPFEMRYLAERLHQEGHTCVCPLLPGHGTHLSFFARTTWRDWFQTAQSAFEQLVAEVEGSQVAVVGQSLGALLGLRLAALWPKQVAALACLATPLSFLPLSAAAITAYRYTPLRLLNLEVPRAGGVDIRETRLRRGLPGYDRLPLRAAASFRELQREVEGLLHRVHSPLVVLHGSEDHTAPLDNAEQVLRGVSSAVKQIEVLQQSYHVLSLDVEKDKVARVLIDFFHDFHNHHPSSPSTRS